MKLLLRNVVFIIIINSIGIKAQVGIGTDTPDSSAVLELSASDKAFYLSRVALTGTDDTVTIHKPKAGFVIVNTANALTGTNKEVNANQIYTYNGTKWVKLINEKTLKEKIGNISNQSLPQAYGYLYANAGTYSFGNMSGFNVINIDTNYTTDYFGNKILGRDSPNQPHLDVHVSGQYVFTGFANLLFNHFTGTMFWQVGMQRKKAGSDKWETFIGEQCPYLYEYRGYGNPCYFSGAVTLEEGDEIRFYAKKNNGSTPSTATLSYVSGIVPFAYGFNVTVYE